MRDLTGSSRIFGGRRFVVFGDWAQIPPVITRVRRSAVVDASLKSLLLWIRFDLMTMMTPVRNVGDPPFSQWFDASQIMRNLRVYPFLAISLISANHARMS